MDASPSPCNPSPRPASASAPRREPNSHRRPWFATILLLLAGIPCAATAWLVVVTTAGGRAGWMALLIAAAAAYGLRISGVPRGSSRSLLAVSATALGILASDWLIAPLSIGMAMGQLPLGAAWHTGLDFAWTLTRLGNTPLDWLYAGSAILLAGWLAA